MYAITYQVRLTQYSPVYVIDGENVRITFEGSVDGRGGIFTTSNPAIIEAIEASQKFKDGFIYVYKEYGTRPEAPKAEIEENTDEDENDVENTGNAENTGEGEGNDTTQEGENAEVVESPAAADAVADAPVVTEPAIVEPDPKKVYPETIKTVQAAGRALQADYGVKAKDVETRAKVLAKAIELNVEFPGLVL